MAKGGPLKFLLPIGLGLGALATGGFGLPGLLGLGGEAAGAGEAAAGTAATLGDVGPAATADLLSAGAGPLDAGVAATEAATPLSAGAAALSAAPDLAALSAGVGDVATGPLSGGTLGALGPPGAAGPAGATTDLATAGAAPVTGGVSAGAAPVAAAGQPISEAVGAAPTLDQFMGLPEGTSTSGLSQQDLQTFFPAEAAAGATPPIAGTEAAPAAGGGIFGTGVTGGDIFKEIGGLRGLTGLLSAGMMGSQLLKGVRQYPEQQDLQGQAAHDLSTAAMLQQPLTTGALPTGAQSAVDLATAASKARISNAYANMGLSGSTMESEALNQADQQAAAQKFGIADQLFSQAQGYSQMGTDTTKSLLQTAMTEDQQYREALANFAKALAGTGAGIGSTTSPTYTLTPA